MNDDPTDGEKQDFQFLELCRLLNEHDVHYLICGGYACILHGNLRMTQDVDLLVEESRENYTRLIAALSLFGDGSAKELTEEDIEENLVVKINDVITIDVSRRAWVVTYAEAAPQALREKIEGVEIPYLGMKDLIRSKQTDRDKDRLDIQQLMRLPVEQRDEMAGSVGSANANKPAKGCLGMLTGFLAFCFVIFFWLALAPFSRADEVTSADFTVNTLDVSGGGAEMAGVFTVNTLITNSSPGNGRESGEFTVETRGLDAPRSSAVNPSLPTVIMTHGWNSKSEAWARPMADAMVQKLGMTGWNIVTWDWREEAALTVNNVINGGQFVPSDKTEPQGVLLGQRLYTLLGAGYGQPVHFIGHSLGALVNRFACDYLHQSGRWSSGATQPHVTLLDEAELASAGGVKVLSTPLLVAQESYARMLKELKGPDAFNPGGILLDNAARATWEALGRTVMAAIDDWKSPIPTSAAYVDNYVSLVGWNRSASANVCLAPPLGGLSEIIQAHSYAPNWYRLSLEHLGTVGMGFPRALETGGVVPPPQPQYQAGSLWLQSPVSEFSLVHLPVESFPGACSSYTLLNIAAAKQLKYLVSGELQTSDFINVSGIAGRRVEFYFGFHGGTSTASGIIEGLRFMTMPQPTLAMTQDVANEVELHWSAAASGWKLEESPDLSGGSWALSPFPHGAIIEDGVMSVRMPITAGTKKFFRLRRME